MDQACLRKALPRSADLSLLNQTNALPGDVRYPFDPSWASITHPRAKQGSLSLQQGAEPGEPLLFHPGTSGAALATELSSVELGKGGKKSRNCNVSWNSLGERD